MTTEGDSILQRAWRAIGETDRSSERTVVGRLQQRVKQPPTSTEEKQETILDRVIAQLCEDPWSVVHNGVSHKFISRLSNVDLKNVLRHAMHDKEGAVRRALVRELQPDRDGYTEGVVQAMLELARQENHDPLSALTALIVDGYGTNIGSETGLTATRFAWVAASGEPEIRAALANLYQTLDQRIAPAMGELMTAWRRRPVEPFTWELVSLSITTVVEGLATRATFDTEVDAKLLGDVVFALFHGMTMSIDEPDRHVKDAVVVG